MRALKFIGLVAGLVVLYCVLDACGLMVSKRIRALVYVGHRGGASFSACTGTVRRTIRVRETKIYRVTMTARLTAGSVEVEFLDRKKLPLAALTPEEPTARVALERGVRYTLVQRYASASGELKVKLE